MPYDTDTSAQPEPDFPSLMQGLSSADESMPGFCTPNSPVSGRIGRLGSGHGAASSLGGSTGSWPTSKGVVGAASAHPNGREQEDGTIGCDGAAAPRAMVAQAGFMNALGKRGSTVKDERGSDTNENGGGGGREKAEGVENLFKAERAARMFRPQVKSFAERHHQDVSAEINSLSKVLPEATL